MKASQIIPAARFFVFVIAIFIFIVHGRQRYNERFGRFLNTSINGNIVFIQNLGRGDAEFVTYQNYAGDTTSFVCSAVYYIEKYGISVGDSIVKKEQSDVLTIIKKDAGKQKIISFQVE